MKISVIIPTFSRSEILRRTLNLLATQTFDGEFEVVVIDDGSTDDTPRLLAEFEKKKVFDFKFLSQKNAGQATARNRGIEIATGEILIFLGDDMLPHADFLAEHAAFHSAHPAENFAALGFVEWSREIRVTKFMRWLERSGVQFKFHDLAAGGETDFWRFYTANISLKKSFLGDERFDENFHGWGFEDAEFGFRLQKKGLKLLFHPAAATSHFHEISDENLEERMRSGGRNLVQFARKFPHEKILPSRGKRRLQKILANVLFFTFWGKSKKAFLAGVDEAERG